MAPSRTVSSGTMLRAICPWFSRKSAVIDIRGNFFGAGYRHHERGSTFRLNRKGEFNILHRFGEDGPSATLQRTGYGQRGHSSICVAEVSKDLQ